ncbi:surface lipoprotein assembly modifier [Pseudooctadecabacter sp.]|uniref:surface lipoprotein assembly modifier n=1 Tax=Pseudooctadecabacter sp. TaxID=1966338 RepID=UPI0035C8744D
MTGLLAREWFAERDLRHMSATARVDVVDRRQGQTFRFGAYVTHTHHDGRDGPPSSLPDATRYGLRGAWPWDDGDMRRGLRGKLEYRDYVHQDARDAGFASVDLDWSRPLSDRTRLSWGGGVEHMRPALSYQRYWGANAHMGVTRQVTDTTRLGATARLALRRYDHDFASVDYARTDEIFKLGLSASNSQIRVAGAVPKLTCSHTEHRSNIALYQTRYTDCGVTFSFDS